MTVRSSLIATCVLALALVGSAHASAPEVGVVPYAPVDCKQSKVEDVASVTVVGSQSGDKMTFSLLITNNKCHAGQYVPAPVKNDYGIYMINYEYSSDFRYTSTQVGTSAVDVEVKLNLKTFFADQPVRTFDIELYRSQEDQLSYAWKLTFTQDPTTGKALLKLIPREPVIQ